MQDRFRVRAWDTEEGRYASDEDIYEQCTGLKDKNNKLIYEGDILAVSPDSHPWDCYKVFWQDDECQFQAVSYDGPDAYVEPLNGLLEEGNMEIIGNIYENPELLEEDK